MNFNPKTMSYLTYTNRKVAFLVPDHSTHASAKDIAQGSTCLLVRCSDVSLIEFLPNSARVYVCLSLSL